ARPHLVSVLASSCTEQTMAGGSMMFFMGVPLWLLLAGAPLRSPAFRIWRRRGVAALGGLAVEQPRRPLPNAGTGRPRGKVPQEHAEGAVLNGISGRTFTHERTPRRGCTPLP